MHNITPYIVLRNWIPFKELDFGESPFYSLKDKSYSTGKTVVNPRLKHTNIYQVIQRNKTSLMPFAGAFWGNRRNHHQQCCLQIFWVLKVGCVSYPNATVNSASSVTLLWH